MAFGSADNSAESQQSQHPEGKSGEPPQKRSRGEKHLMALISDVIHPPNHSQSPTEKALAEAR